MYHLSSLLYSALILFYPLGARENAIAIDDINGNKLGNLPERIIPLLAEALESVPSATPWSKRLVLGCWSAAFFPLCESYLPGFETALIGFDLWYAARVLRGSPAAVNVNQKVLERRR